jgi:hypothetical protein
MAVSPSGRYSLLYGPAVERPATEQELDALSRGWGGTPKVYWFDVLVGFTGGILASAPFSWLLTQLGLTDGPRAWLSLILGQAVGMGWAWWNHQGVVRIYDDAERRGRKAYEAGVVQEWAFKVARCWEVDIQQDSHSPGYVLQSADGRALYVLDQGFYDGYPEELEVPLRQMRVVWEPTTQRILEVDMGGEQVALEPELAGELYDDEDRLIQVKLLSAAGLYGLVREGRKAS